MCQEDSGETAPQLILEVPSDTETEQQQGPGRHQARARHIHRARGESGLNWGDHMMIRSNDHNIRSHDHPTKRTSKLKYLLTPGGGGRRASHAADFLTASLARSDHQSLR